MARSKLVGLLLEAWRDFDRALGGLSPADATRPLAGGSSPAWTAGHLANQLDIWINVRFQKRQPHPLIGDSRFRFGAEGRADDWPAVQAGVDDVRGSARRYLEPMAETDLDLVVPYEGSFPRLRDAGLSLRYALLRICAHHYFHTGEIASKRVALGHAVGDYPGPLDEAI